VQIAQDRGPDRVARSCAERLPEAGAGHCRHEPDLRGLPGLIGVTDRDFKDFWHVAIPGESVENGIAVDDRGGIYFVTSKQMRNVAWTGKKLTTVEAGGAWASAYDIGPHKPQSLSSGSGVTPTLMGFGDDQDQLVLIADAADPVKKVVTFWRDDDPATAQQKTGAPPNLIDDQIALTTPRLVLSSGRSMSTARERWR
jgi:hypothetical protein